MCKQNLKSRGLNIKSAKGFGVQYDIDEGQGPECKMVGIWIYRGIILQ
jgi:hypothetical protein